MKDGENKADKKKSGDKADGDDDDDLDGDEDDDVVDDDDDMLPAAKASVPAVNNANANGNGSSSSSSSSSSSAAADDLDKTVDLDQFELEKLAALDKIENEKNKDKDQDDKDSDADGDNADAEDGNGKAFHAGATGAKELKVEAKAVDGDNADVDAAILAADAVSGEENTNAAFGFDFTTEVLDKFVDVNLTGVSGVDKKHSDSIMHYGLNKSSMGGNANAPVEL